MAKAKIAVLVSVLAVTAIAAVSAECRIRRWRRVAKTAASTKTSVELDSMAVEAGAAIQVDI